MVVRGEGSERGEEKEEQFRNSSGMEKSSIIKKEWFGRGGD